MTVEQARVLVVDDDESVRKALSALLAGEGYLIEVAGNGEEALRVLSQFDPDVVLTDLHMPVLDGLGLLERGKPLAPHATFVMMTAFASIETAVQAVKQGAENYLTKPLDFSSMSAL